MKPVDLNTPAEDPRLVAAAKELKRYLGGTEGSLINAARRALAAADLVERWKNTVELVSPSPRVPPHVEIEEAGHRWWAMRYRVRLVLAGSVMEHDDVVGIERAEEIGRRMLKAHLGVVDSPRVVRRIEAWEVSDHCEPPAPPPGPSGVSPSPDGSR